MAKQKLALVVTDNTKIRLGGRSAHNVFANPPQQLITVTQPSLSTCIPRQAEGLFAAKSNEELMVELGKLLAEIDLDTFIVGIYVKDEDPNELPSALVMGQCRPDWIARYDDQGYIDVDTRMAHCLNNTTPFLWDRTSFGARDALPLFEEAASYGLRAGIAAPLLTHQGYLGMFSASSSLDVYVPDLLSPVIRGRFLILKDYLSELLGPKNRSVVSLAHTSADGSGVKLSRRQSEVLFLFASGYDATKIADRLHVSDSAVRAHLAIAKTRLGVTKLSHAVARALKHNLIPFPD